MQLDTLGDVATPIIAHLHSPDHFIVVVDVRGDDCIISDADGKYRRVSVGMMQRRWSGHVLKVSKRNDDQHIRSGPRAEADTLVQIRTEEEVSHDRGTIEFTYLIQNTGSEPLVITDVETDCSCIDARWTDGSIAPGLSGEVSLAYHRAESTWETGVHRVATLRSNDITRTALSLHAIAVASRKISVAPTEINFGRVVRGTESIKHVYVRMSEEVANLADLVSVTSTPGVDVLGIMSTGSSHDANQQLGHEVRRAMGAINASVVRVQLRFSATATPDFVDEGVVTGVLEIFYNGDQVSSKSVSWRAVVTDMVEASPRTAVFESDNAGGMSGYVSEIWISGCDDGPWRVRKLRTNRGVPDYDTHVTGGRLSVTVRVSPEDAEHIHGQKMVVDVENLNTGEHVQLGMPIYVVGLR